MLKKANNEGELWRSEKNHFVVRDRNRAANECAKIALVPVIQKWKMVHKIWLGHSKPIPSIWTDGSDREDMGHLRHMSA